MNGNIKQEQAELALYQQSCPDVSRLIPRQFTEGIGREANFIIKNGMMGGMEGVGNNPNKEFAEMTEERMGEIERLIEGECKKVEMYPDAVYDDMATFYGLGQEDESAKGYFEALAERLGITIEEMLKYAEKVYLSE